MHTSTPEHFPRSPRPAPARRLPRAFPWETLAIFLVALALRVAYTWLAQGREAFASSDSASYDDIAWNLARGLGFQATGGGGALYPTAFRPPALPFVTSLVYRIAGHSYLAALGMQCVIGALIPVALAEYVRSTVGSSAARIAGWLAAVHPMLVFFCSYLLTEPLFALTMLLALGASSEWVKTPRPGRALGAGLLWGAATLTRPNALVMPLLVAAWAWFPLGLALRGSDRVRQVAMLVLGVALVVGPWTMRNARAMHAFVPVTTGGGRALLDANNAIIWDDPATRGGALNIEGFEPYASQLRGLPEAAQDATAGRLARQFMLSRAGQWPSVALAKLGRFWRLRTEGGVLTKQWRRSGTPLDALVELLDPLFVYSLLVLPLAVVGVVITLRGPRRLFQSLPLITIAASTLGAIVYWGALRMRMPVEPLVLFYAAVGADVLVKRWRVRRSGLGLVERHSPVT
jgi:4-amino-4-deoxy-L-arabinose transferase-like glycosyltransferase